MINVTKSWLGLEAGSIESLINTIQKPSLESAAEYTKDLANVKLIIKASEYKQLYLPYHSFLYFLCRVLKLETVVETGVERGSSTYMILKAMEKNGKGVLHSVELCKEINLPKNVVVPLALMLEGEDELKKRWVLHYGNSLKVIPELIKEIGLDKEIDLFVHGSDHSYEVQSIELDYARVWVKGGSYVVVDRNDYSDNQALDKIFPEANFQRWVLPEKSVKSPLKFAVVQL